MHIILGLLGSVVTILWLLHRLAEMGIDLGGLNPWAWRRRRKWRKAYEGNPIFSMDSPMEITALLLTATAKSDGDMTAEDKSKILGLFQSEFELAESDASSLLASSTYLLGSGEELKSSLNSFIESRLEYFADSQVRSAITMLQSLGGMDASSSKTRVDFVSTVCELMEKKFAEKHGDWA
ncbi:MAG: hypothetical protein AAF385_07690 [Pseudomonadota bacterium]